MLCTFKVRGVSHIVHFFFFQAEDGIRDVAVTGVQTCALPISCSMKARQGPTACEGMAVPMDKLDNLVADHLESQLLQPERLEAILASVLDRRQEQIGRASCRERV